MSNERRMQIGTVPVFFCLRTADVRSTTSVSSDAEFDAHPISHRDEAHPRDVTVHALILGPAFRNEAQPPGQRR